MVVESLLFLFSFLPSTFSIYANNTKGDSKASFCAKRCTQIVAAVPATAAKPKCQRGEREREREIKSRRGRLRLGPGSVAIGARRVQRRAVRATDTVGSAAYPCRSDICPCRATTSCRASRRPGRSSRPASDRRRRCRRRLAAWAVSGVAKTLAVGRLKSAKGEKERAVVGALGQTSDVQASTGTGRAKTRGTRTKALFQVRRTRTGRGRRRSFFFYAKRLCSRFFENSRRSSADAKKHDPRVSIGRGWTRPVVAVAPASGF